MKTKAYVNLYKGPDAKGDIVIWTGNNTYQTKEEAESFVIKNDIDANKDIGFVAVATIEWELK